MRHAAIVVLSAVPALAQDQPLERREMPPAATGPQARALPYHGAGRGLTMRQVNLDENGMDIVGDAANEPSLDVDPTAPLRIVLAWRQFDTTASSFRESGYSYSVDGGRTWAPKRTYDDGTFRTDPVIRFDAEGVCYWNSLRVSPYECDVSISTDAGATWSEPIFAYGGDKAWIAIDRTVGIGHGNIYQWWNIAGNEFRPNTFNRSVDSGGTWSEPQRIPDSPVFGTISVGPAGELYGMGVSNGFYTDRFWFMRSLDAQDPDATPTFQVQSLLGGVGGYMRGATGPNPSGLLGQAQVVVDSSGGPRHGWIYLLCSVEPYGDPDPMDVHLLRSTDGGATWTAPIRVNSDPPHASAWQWFGTVSIAPDGRLDVVWVDTRDSLVTHMGRIYTRSSHDGGDSWTDEVALTDAWDSRLGWPQQNKIGDYYDMQSDLVGADVAVATTLNGGQDVYYIRIGDFDCNRNGISDAADLAAGEPDCNGNGIPDSCEIAAGTLRDCDGDGTPDACDEAFCAADLAPPTGILNVFDFLAFQGAFGGDEPCADLAEPIGVLDVFDFLAFQTVFGNGC